MFISSFEIENILYPNSTLDVSLAKDLLKDQLNNDYYTRDLFVQAYSAYNFTKQDLSFAAAHIEFDNTDLFDIFENMSDDDYNSIYKTISSTNILR